MRVADQTKWAPLWGGGETTAVQTQVLRSFPKAEIEGLNQRFGGSPLQ